MILSILVLSIPNRIEKAASLLKKIQGQIATGGYEQVEVICLYDNKKSSIGRKREIAMQMAQGNYVTFIDDDDDICDGYIKNVVEAARDGVPDVIVFNVNTWLNGEGPFVVRYGIEYANEECHKVGGKWADIKRKPFHNCVWNAKIAKSESFKDVSYCEDWDWLKRVIPKAEKQKRIDNILLNYMYDESVSESADSVNFKTHV